MSTPPPVPMPGGMVYLIGTAIIAAVGLAGHFLTRLANRYQVSTDDRKEFTKDVLKRQSEVEARMDAAEARERQANLREVTYLRIFTTVGAELRAINSALNTHCVQIASREDRGALMDNAQQIRNATRALARMVEASETELGITHPIVPVREPS